MLQLVCYDNILNIKDGSFAVPNEMLYALLENNNNCFPDEIETNKQYKKRLIGFIHRDLRKCPYYIRKNPGVINILEQSTAYKLSVSSGKLRNWKLFVLFQDVVHHKHIVASCLVECKKLEFEIHEVCVSMPGKGYCQVFLTKVKDYLTTLDNSLPIVIYCKYDNVAACKCYKKVFGEPKKTPSPTWLKKLREKSKLGTDDILYFQSLTKN